VDHGAASDPFSTEPAAFMGMHDPSDIAATAPRRPLHGRWAGHPPKRQRADARIKIATWIADFYNTTRRHSANGGLAPIPFEHQMAQARAASAAQVKAEVA
jgi:transposase InsO family protein